MAKKKATTKGIDPPIFRSEVGRLGHAANHMKESLMRCIWGKLKQFSYKYVWIHENRVNLGLTFLTFLPAASRLLLHLKAQGTYVKEGWGRQARSIAISWFKRGPHGLPQEGWGRLKRDHFCKAKRSFSLQDQLWPPMPFSLRAYLCKPTFDSWHQLS